jgi:hypothetical protein
VSEPLGMYRSPRAARRYAALRALASAGDGVPVLGAMQTGHGGRVAHALVAGPSRGPGPTRGIRDRGVSLATGGQSWLTR